MQDFDMDTYHHCKEEHMFHHSYQVPRRDHLHQGRMYLAQPQLVWLVIIATKMFQAQSVMFTKTYLEVMSSNTSSYLPDL